MPAVGAVSAVGVPGLLGGGGGGLRGVGVLGKVGSTGVLDLRGVYNVLSVVSELDVGLGSVPLAVAASVPSAVSCARTIARTVSTAEPGTEAGVAAVRGLGGGGRVRSDVGSLQVGDLGGVNDATVVGEGSWAVFHETGSRSSVVATSAIGGASDVCCSGSPGTVNVGSLCMCGQMGGLGVCYLGRVQHILAIRAELYVRRMAGVVGCLREAEESGKDDLELKKLQY